MARNKLTDLNNLLFAQLERLNDEELTEEQMKLEISKATAMSKVSSQIINSSKLVLQAATLMASGKVDKENIPQNLIDKI